MKRLDQLVTQVRLQTNEASFSSTSGLQQAEVVQYFNDAQSRLQSVILSRVPHCAAFDKSSTQTLVAGQRSYYISGSATYTDGAFGNTVRLVEFSYNGDTENFCSLDRVPTRDLDPTECGYPTGYEIRGASILLSPVPDISSGTLRITYAGRLDALDVTRGRINGTPSGSTIDLTHSTGSPTAENEAAFVVTPYDSVCISNRVGDVMLRNAVVGSYDTATDVLTLNATVSGYLVTGYTLADLADGFLTLGENTTTTSKLPTECERYLLGYARWKILKRGSSNNSGEQEGELRAMESDILASFSSHSLDVQFTPIISSEWLY